VSFVNISAPEVIINIIINGTGDCFGRVVAMRSNQSSRLHFAGWFCSTLSHRHHKM